MMPSGRRYADDHEPVAPLVVQAATSPTLAQYADDDTFAHDYLVSVDDSSLPVSDALVALQFPDVLNTARRRGLVPDGQPMLASATPDGPRSVRLVYALKVAKL